MEKRIGQRVVVVSLTVLLALLCFRSLAYKLIEKSYLHSEEFPETGMYYCEEIDMELSFDGDVIFSKYLGAEVPVYLDYGNNLHIEDNAIQPIAAGYWNKENNTIVLEFRRAPLNAEIEVPYVYRFVK